MYFEQQPSPLLPLLRLAKEGNEGNEEKIRRTQRSNLFAAETASGSARCVRRTRSIISDPYQYTCWTKSMKTALCCLCYLLFNSPLRYLLFNSPLRCLRYLLFDSSILQSRRFPD